MNAQRTGARWKTAAAALAVLAAGFLSTAAIGSAHPLALLATTTSPNPDPPPTTTAPAPDVPPRHASRPPAPPPPPPAAPHPRPAVHPAVRHVAPPPPAPPPAPVVTPQPRPPVQAVVPPPPSPPAPPHRLQKAKPRHKAPRATKHPAHASPASSLLQRASHVLPGGFVPTPTATLVSGSRESRVAVAVTLLALLILLAATMPARLLRGPFAAVRVHRVAIASTGFTALISAIVVYVVGGS